MKVSYILLNKIVYRINCKLNPYRVLVTMCVSQEFIYNVSPFTINHANQLYKINVKQNIYRAKTYKYEGLIFLSLTFDTTFSGTLPRDFSIIQIQPLTNIFRTLNSIRNTTFDESLNGNKLTVYLKRTLPEDRTL